MLTRRGFLKAICAAPAVKCLPLPPLAPVERLFAVWDAERLALGLGDYVPSSFVVPQLPVERARVIVDEAVAAIREAETRYVAKWLSEV